MQQKSRHHPPDQGQLRCRLTRRTVKKGSQQGSAPVKCSCQIQWWTPMWGLVVGLRFLRSYCNWWDMTRQAPWFHSFVPGDVGGCIRMSEAVDSSTLLVSTAYTIQLPCHNCPHIRETRYSRDIQVDCKEKKDKNNKRQIIFFFFFIDKSWIKDECIECICCEHRFHEAKSTCNLNKNA